MLRHKPPDKSMNIPLSKLVNFDRKIDRVPNQYIVIYRDDSEWATISAYVDATTFKVEPTISALTTDGTAALSLAFARRYGFTLNRIYKTNDGLRGFVLSATNESDLMDLAQDPRIKFVEPVLIAHPQTTMNIQSTGAPNCTDSYCAPQCKGGACVPWDLDRIDQVWSIDGLYHYVATGAGVTIWLADTGFQHDHVDFNGRTVALAGQNGNACTVDGNGNITDQCQFVPVTNSADYDPYGHGTLVASIAAGNTYGVAKRANIDVQQVCGNSAAAGEDCTTAWIAAAIDFSIANRSSGPNILLSALTVIGTSAVFDASVNRALAIGMTVVVDAGNQGTNACDNSPGDVAGAITVGGTDYSNNVDSLWSQSNFGPCVDILAPALYLWAADNGNGDGDCGVAQNSTTGVCAFSGTSVAAPLVAGIAALYLQNYPNASPAAVKSAINSAAAQISIAGVTPLSGTPSLMASVWVPGNTAGAEPPGGGFPPFGGGTVTLPSGIIMPIVNLVLN
jgi:hypothetical protein